MSQQDHPTVTSTDFSFVNALLEFGEDYIPRPGDVVDLKYSDLKFKNGEKFSGGSATVVSTGDETVVLLVDLDGEKYEASVDGYFYLKHSPTITAAQQEAQRKSAPDGVAFSDSCVPAELTARLRGHVQRLIESEPADYHPGSGTRVRDLVHPSLYPYIKGVSQEIGPLPTTPKPTYDRFGRPFESSQYQWLPTPFRIEDDGSTTITSYINNLDEMRHGALKEDLARLFSAVLPMIEGVLGYVDSTRFWVEACDIEHEGELPEVSGAEVTPVTPRPLRGQELLVIPKIVEYKLTAGETHEGVWHVEGMSHEHIVATCVYILDRDECLQGGELQFKRAYTVEEAGRLFWNINQVRPTTVQDIVDEGTIPAGTVATPAGRVLVFPNSHIHKLSALTVAPGAAQGRRRVIVFWIVDPDVRIPSTREIAPQQGVLSREDALGVRLALMEERRLHKATFNPRAVSLCEH